MVDFTKPIKDEDLHIIANLMERALGLVIEAVDLSVPTRIILAFKPPTDPAVSFLNTLSKKRIYYEYSFAQHEPSEDVIAHLAKSIGISPEAIKPVSGFVKNPAAGQVLANYLMLKEIADRILEMHADANKLPDDAKAWQIASNIFLGAVSSEIQPNVNNAEIESLIRAAQILHSVVHPEKGAMPSELGGFATSHIFKATFDGILVEIKPVCQSTDPDYIKKLWEKTSVALCAVHKELADIKPDNMAFIHLEHAVKTAIDPKNIDPFVDYTVIEKDNPVFKLLILARLAKAILKLDGQIVPDQKTSDALNYYDTTRSAFDLRMLSRKGHNPPNPLTAGTNPYAKDPLALRVWGLLSPQP